MSKIKMPSKGGVYTVDGTKVKQTSGPEIERQKEKAKAAAKAKADADADLKARQSKGAK